MKKVAILVEDSYQVLEVWYPYFRLKEEGFEVILAGTGRKDTYLSKEGYPAKEDRPISKLKAGKFEAVIIPGGYAPDILRRYKEVNNFVREVFKRGKVVAAICHGGWVLVSSNILKGKTVTGFFAIKDDLVNAGAKFIDKEVVVDNNLITSRKPEDLPAFLQAIVSKLRP